MSFQLRSYQEAAISATWRHIREKKTNPVIVAPTGSGKSLLIAQLCRDVVSWKGKVISLAHVRELLEQASSTLSNLAPEIPVGIYSAGLRSRDTGYAVTFAGIQSVYQRAEEFGSVDIILQDEVHLTPEEGEGMYRTFLSDMQRINPNVRLIGLTATAFRLSTGLICKPKNLYQEICYEIGIKELIRDGYLSPLKPRAGKDRVELSSVHVRGGEFIPAELEASMNEGNKVALAVLDILDLTQDRKSVLIFACGVAHGNAIANALHDATDSVAEVYGDTPYQERDEIIRRFRSGNLKYLVNVNVLSTGFDSPNVDAICMMRPTLSPGLMMQQLGRGFRMAPGKDYCAVLDYADNILRHGMVDSIRPPSGKSENGTWNAPAKACPECRALVHAGYSICPECGYEFPRPEAKHGIRSNGAAVISGQPEEYQVVEVSYWLHRKKDAPPDHPPTLRVEYDCGLMYPFKEYIALQHQGFSRTKAVKWWRARSDQPVPQSVDAALAAIAMHGIKEPARILIGVDGKYTRVMGAFDFTHKAPPEKEKPEDVGMEEEVAEIDKIEKTLTSPQEELGW